MHKIEMLDNGLKVATEPMDHMESVALGIWIRTGGRYEEQKNSGISHLLEHMLFKGTKTRDMKAIKESIEGRGGSFNGFTSEENTCYLVKVLSKDADLGMDILSDMVLNPKLDAVEMEKEKNVIIEEINMYKDLPSQHVHEILAEMMWPEQPLGMPLAGTVESVRSIARSELVSYKEGRYNPVNTFVIGAGRINEDTLINLSKKYFSGLPGGKPTQFKKAVVKQAKPLFKLNTKDTEQTHVALGFHGQDRSHKDRYPLSLLNIVMGANMSSRLFHIVRDEQALCYEISSSVRRYEDCGAFVVSVGVDDKKLIKALDTILAQLSRIKKEPVSEEELNRAKEYYRGQLLFALEDTMSHMLWLGEKVVAGEKELDTKNIIKAMEKVKAEDLTRVACDIFSDEKLNLAIIGPVKDGKAVGEVLHLV